jgi:hypothetical protein
MVAPVRAVRLSTERTTMFKRPKVVAQVIIEKGFASEAAAKKWAAKYERQASERLHVETHYFTDPDE